jgi:hypothetical protein
MTELIRNLNKCEAFHLIKYAEEMEQLGIVLHKSYPLDKLNDKLSAISEQLYYEECDNFGISKKAIYLRKQWRKTCREMKRTMKLWIKNHKLYEKEWSKPRQIYISNATGECHNGLYWTIRAIITEPYLGLRWTKER